MNSKNSIYFRDKIFKLDELTVLEYGNTRKVRYLDEDYIIKEDYEEEEFCPEIPKNLRKYYCNNKEYILYSNATEIEKTFLCPVLKIYNGGKYIVCKKCDKTLIDLLLSDYNLEVDEIEETYQDIEDFTTRNPQYKLNISEVSKFCKKNKLHKGELRLISNWGVLNGQLVCLDYN